MSYSSGREHYHEPLPLRSGTQPHHALLFSQRPRDNRPEPIDLSLISKFDDYNLPLTYASPPGPTTAELQAEINAEFGALIGNRTQPGGEEFLQQRARLRHVPKIERPSVNILEPPSRGYWAPLSSSFEILPSEGSASPTSEYRTPARIRKRFPRTLDLELADQFQRPPYGSSSSSPQYSPGSSSDSDSSVLYMRPIERVPLLPSTARSPNAGAARPFDTLQHVTRHPHRRSSYLNNRYSYSTGEEHRPSKEDARETWGRACLDCLFFGVLLVLFTFAIFSYACIVLLFFRNWMYITSRGS
ncbi:uncharacterized protein FFB20_07684 [Fusarium fujikuroi]|nr:uncharacterized protein Y057_3441 [Fusarium fujikuroi]KLP16967.1 uncharacterized protein LW94_14391 [Fusarium fujikuroi]QGI65721.1 hypothetical protein CEK27_009692 [Fusarium fujikuroi]QGI82965.1 hypothetical protein CEK25_009694 [Fusarium fujikuroi]QGI96602.1 hypothetical protein CEK26_009671 [Fusarium fujikuroi]